LRTALNLDDGPTAIRYPRSRIPSEAALARYYATTVAREEGFRATNTLPIGKARRLQEGSDLAILALGNMVPVALECADILAEQGINARVIDMLWVKPLDVEAVQLAASTGHIVTLENGCLKGGFGSAILEELVNLQLYPLVQTFGIPDRFIEHGSQAILAEELGMTADDIVLQILQKNNST